MAARTKIEWASNPNQRLACSPLFLPNTMPAMIDWELCSSGTEILELDTTTAGEDCQGEWTGTEGWVGGRGGGGLQQRRISRSLRREREWR